uniref:ATP binding protein n=1 Tax=Rhizophora mucronata TaxID=61149 RepID=A0A2P2JZU6_RHIMU
MVLDFHHPSSLQQQISLSRSYFLTMAFLPWAQSLHQQHLPHQFPFQNQHWSPVLWYPFHQFSLPGIYSIHGTSYLMI